MDAPWPPVYPKQPNEPPRVSPQPGPQARTPEPSPVGRSETSALARLRRPARPGPVRRREAATVGQVGSGARSTQLLDVVDGGRVGTRGWRSGGTAGRRSNWSCRVAASLAAPRTVTSQSSAIARDVLEVPVAGEHGGAPTWRPSRGGRGSRRRCRRPGPGSPGSTPAARRTSPRRPRRHRDRALAPVELHDRSPPTHWPRSLSGVQMSTGSTRVVGGGDRRPRRRGRRRPRTRPSANTVNPSASSSVLDQRELGEQLGLDARARPCSRATGRCGTTR